MVRLQMDFGASAGGMRQSGGTDCCKVRSVRTPTAGQSGARVVWPRASGTRGLAMSYPSDILQASASVGVNGPWFFRQVKCSRLLVARCVKAHVLSGTESLCPIPLSLVCPQRAEGGFSISLDDVVAGTVCHIDRAVGCTYRRQPKTLALQLIAGTVIFRSTEIDDHRWFMHMHPGCSLPAV